MKKLLISLVGLSLVLGVFAGCGMGSEKDRFISASVEVGCAIFDNPDLFADATAVDSKAIEVFSEYGFDATDEEAMLVLTEKYQNDEEILKAVQEGITDCAGDALSQMLMDEANF